MQSYRSILKATHIYDMSCPSLCRLALSCIAAWAHLHRDSILCQFVRMIAAIVVKLSDSGDLVSLAFMVALSPELRHGFIVAFSSGLADVLNDTKHNVTHIT